MRASDFPYFDASFHALAHRGGPQLPTNVGRENSLHAFGAAVALGYRYIETDVHATKDGVLVAFHDDRLDRVTDATGLLAELTFEEVRRARIGGTEPIPTFAEALEAFPDTRWNIDIKAAGAVDPLVDVLHRHAAHDRVCVTSFSDRRLSNFRRRVGAPVAVGSGRNAVFRARFLPWLPRLGDATGVVFQVPVDIQLAGRRVRIVTPEFIAGAHRAGQQVHVWTINDPAQMHELIDLGVDGLVSDRIDVLREVLLARGRWQ